MISYNTVSNIFKFSSSHLIHILGLYAVLGFCDKLRYMTVLIDDLQELREFPIRNCNACSYSNNGHMFAAADGNVIEIFSTITFERMFNLKGHFGEVMT